MREKSGWVETGSVVMQTQEYRYRTMNPTTKQGLHDMLAGGIELVLTRAANGSWKLSCAELWSGGESKIIAGSDVDVSEAKIMALGAAYNRCGELMLALPRR